METVLIDKKYNSTLKYFYEIEKEGDKGKRLDEFVIDFPPNNELKMKIEKVITLEATGPKVRGISGRYWEAVAKILEGRLLNDKLTIDFLDQKSKQTTDRLILNFIGEN